MRVCLRIVIPGPPNGSPYNSNDTKHPERGAPPERRLQRYHNQGRQSSTRTAASPYEALRSCTFHRREPPGDDASHVGICAGLTGSEQEPCCDKWIQPAHDAGHRSKCRPPNHNSRDDFPLAEPVAHGTRRHLERTIRQHKRTQYPSPLLRSKAKIELHSRTGRGDRQPVQKRDHGQQRQQTEDDVALLHRDADADSRKRFGHGFNRTSIQRVSHLLNGQFGRRQNGYANRTLRQCIQHARHRCLRQHHNVHLRSQSK